MSPLTVNLWAIVMRESREAHGPTLMPAIVDEEPDVWKGPNAAQPDPRLSAIDDEIASLREDGPEDPTGEAHARHAAMLCELEEEREQIARQNTTPSHVEGAP